mmetsp:Transcript_20245/g.35147  ORF Transcript_20245/g.35147 Transcript_20245/m.35147 type:complete len:310 (-) Transcript_20245:116-1045(-)
MTRSAGQSAVQVAQYQHQVGNAHHEPGRQMELLPQRVEAHGHHGLVQHLPELNGRAIGHHVVLAQGRGSRVQRLRAENQTVAVVVHVAEGNQVLAGAENAQLAGARGLQQVGQEKAVSGSVHLVRRHSNGQQIALLRATGISHCLLAEGLGLCVRLQKLLGVLAAVDLQQFLFGEPVDVGVRERKPCTGTGAHDDLLNTQLLACVKDINGSLVVHLHICGRSMVRSNQSSNVKDTFGAFACALHVLRVSNITLEILDLVALHRILRSGRDVKGNDSIAATLHQHLHETLTDEATSASDTRRFRNILKPR